MPDEAAFVKTVLDSPFEAAPRLVFADWLEERGDPRGELLRIWQDVNDAIIRRGFCPALHQPQRRRVEQRRHRGRVRMTADITRLVMVAAVTNYRIKGQKKRFKDLLPCEASRRAVAGGLLSAFGLIDKIALDRIHKEGKKAEDKAVVGMRKKGFGNHRELEAYYNREVATREAARRVAARVPKHALGRVESAMGRFEWGSGNVVNLFVSLVDFFLSEAPAILRLRCILDLNTGDHDA